jgi:hypothetical protein
MFLKELRHVLLLESFFRVAFKFTYLSVSRLSNRCKNINLHASTTRTSLIRLPLSQNIAVAGSCERRVQQRAGAFLSFSLSSCEILHLFWAYAVLWRIRSYTPGRAVVVNKSCCTRRLDLLFLCVICCNLLAIYVYCNIVNRGKYHGSAHFHIACRA